MLNCVSVPNSPRTYLVAAPWIVCFSGVHARLLVGAVLALGVLAGALAWLAVHVRRAVRARDARTSLLFLFESYHIDSWWYEAVVFGQRFGLALATTVLARTLYLLSAVLSVVFAALTVLLLVRPHRDESVTRLNAATLCTLGLSAGVITQIQYAVADGADARGLVVVLVLLNFSLLLVYAVFVFAPIARVLSSMVRGKRTGLH